MRGFLDKKSKDSRVNDEHSHTGKTDKEENWGRMRYSGGTGLGSRFAEAFCPIARVLSWLGRRASFRPRQELATVSSSTTHPATAATEAIPSYDATDLGSATSTVQLPASSTLQKAVTTPVPSTTQNLTTKSNYQYHETSYSPRNGTTIVSTVSNLATNGTGGYLTKTPITSSEPSVIFTTTLARPNGTSLTAKTWTQTKTTSRGMNTTTTWKTSTTATNTTTSLQKTSSDITTSTTSTTSSTRVSTTVNNDYYPVPQPSTVVYAAPSPANSETETDSTPSTVEPQVVGGIVGGVAGLALVILAIFMLLKRYRRQQAIQALNDAGYGGPLAPPSMVQRSISFLGGGLGTRYREASPGPVDVGPAETGFVKVSGRKLPPAIGGPRPEFGSLRSNAQSSYYTGEGIGVGASGTSRSSHGPARYPSSIVQSSNPFASPPSSPTNIGSTRRGGDADDDSIEEIGILPRSPPPRPIYNRQLSLVSDGVGRSHASHDGSRGSRFTEDIS